MESKTFGQGRRTLWSMEQVMSLEEPSSI